MIDATSVPVIGVTAVPRQVDTLYGPVGGQTMTDPFKHGVAAAGGAAVIVPVDRPASARVLASRLDGLILSGGSDIDPRFYDGHLHETMTWIDPERDEWEMALVAAARELALPILGVCRGFQVLNVERGGTMIAHLDEGLGHAAGWSDPRSRHQVELAPSTLVAELVGNGELRADTTSFHHQALDRIGAGFVVTARALDGTVEAIEDGDHDILGVAWHPELQLSERPGQSLFDWIVRTARGRMAGGSRTGATSV